MFLVRKIVGLDSGTLYAMKVLKKATLKGKVLVYIYSVCTFFKWVDVSKLCVRITALTSYRFYVLLDKYAVNTFTDYEHGGERVLGGCKNPKCTDTSLRTTLSENFRR